METTKTFKETINSALVEAAPAIDKAIKFLVGILVVEMAKRAYRSYTAVTPAVTAPAAPRAVESPVSTPASEVAA